MLRHLLTALLVSPSVLAQDTEPPGVGKVPPPPVKAGADPETIRFKEFPVEDGAPLEVPAATAAAIAGILELQEGEGHDQWPYEGVYREDRGQLPIGYRVGGTSIVCIALTAAPGYAQDADRQAAVARALTFIQDTLDHDRMSIGFIGTYDVRGWGHIYALQLFLELLDRDLVTPDRRELVKEKTAWLVQALHELAIPDTGGWNYSMRAGLKSARNRASTFMTAPALQALFHAKARGFEVADQVLDEALDALERARSEPGGYAYGATAQSQNEITADKLPMMDRVPSSAARATAIETTLLLAGRGDVARHRRAVHRFFEYWDDLAVRKSQTGTHVQPYGIAPYYFLYGHLYAAQAIELLADPTERDALRAKLLIYLARSRDGDGTWNDRQFGRSAGYGSALALLTMQMPHLHRPIARPADEPATGKR